MSTTNRVKSKRISQVRKINRKRGGNGSDSSEDIKYEDMTDEQKRQYDVNTFVKGLDQQKPHFENMSEVLPSQAIVEATEIDEDMTSRLESKQNSERDGSKKSQDKNKLGDSMSYDDDS